MSGRYRVSADGTEPLRSVYTDDRGQALGLASANRVRGVAVTVTDMRTGVVVR